MIRGRIIYLYKPKTEKEKERNEEYKLFDTEKKYKCGKRITEEMIIPVISDCFTPALAKRLIKTEPYSSAVRLILDDTLKLAVKTLPLNRPYFIFVLPISIANNIIYLSFENVFF